MRLIAVVMVAALAACGGDDSSTSSTTQDVDTTNGIWENGLSTNGIWENGIWENGIWENGIWENGIWENGIWENGIWENGIWENGIWENGIWENGIWENGLWQGNPTALTTLRTNPYTRKVMQYVFSCAIPAGRTKTIDAGHHGTCYGTSQDCVLDSECGTDGMCLGGQLDLTGAIGVGVHDDGSVANWDQAGGTCDESCQRWTSACLLARTNAYGVHVHISMRAPDDAPQAVKDALATTQDERTSFHNREGSYYGNIFATGAVGSPVELNACAGPESNVPEITNRFCSSAGDDGPIRVAGSCLTAGGSVGVCNIVNNDPNASNAGAIGDCEGHHEVITVFLADPISVCGNNVCEDDERAGGAHICPSDCHPGTWGNSVPSRVGASAIDTSNDSIVRVAFTNNTVDMGAGALPGGVDPDLVIGFYNADGTYDISRPAHRIALAGVTQQFGDVPEVIFTPTHEIFVVGNKGVFQDDALWVAKLDSNGNLETGWPRTYGGPNDHFMGTFHTVTNGMPGGDVSAFGLGVDSGGSLYIAGGYNGTVSLGATTLTGDFNAFLTKLGPSGNVAWAIDTGDEWNPQNLFVDASDNLWVTSYSAIMKRAPSTGALLDSKTIAGVEIGNLRLDGAGNVYITGSMSGSVNFGDGVPRSGYTNQTFFVASYDNSLSTVRWVYITPQTTCEVLNPDCNVSYAGYRLGFDQFGNVVAGGMGGGDSGGTINMGAGEFEGYGTMDIYFIGLDPSTGAQRWAKHVPLILNGVLQDMHFTSTAKVVMSGLFAGSMLADGELLVSSIPEDEGTFNGFLASFQAPTPDTVAPVIANVPKNITLAAWDSPNGEGFGAIGWFMPPTATDASNAGTNVHCDHRTNEWLHLGTTTVHCTATDSFGNSSTTQFTITVKDLAGPKFTNIPGTIVSSTPVVTYTKPTATDTLDGIRPVTCTPASGSTFPSGNTTVNCYASDLHGNTSHASFVVRVPDTTPPVVTVPANITAEATSASGAIVTFNATANDNVDGVITPTCAPASGSMFGLGTTTVTCGATDAAGNHADASFTVTVRDTTPPVVIVPSTISVTATSASGNVVTYSTSAVDLVDGVVPTICTPASGSLFPLGDTTVNCTATDAHGNVGVGTFHIQVIVSWSGFLQPINADGSSIFKLGSTVPVKFTLTGASAGITDLVAHLSATKISNGIEGDTVEPVSTSAADTGNTFRYTGGQYIFNLATSGLSKGTWRLRADLGDGVVHTVDISLKP